MCRLCYCDALLDKVYAVNKNRRPLMGNGLGYRGICGRVRHNAEMKHSSETLRVGVFYRGRLEVIKRTEIPRVRETIPCGGGVEYLHRIPARRRRQRKGKSRIWDSKIWSQVPRDSKPSMTALARASSYCKRQTRPLVRESSPYQQKVNSLTVIKI
jgi:hypothetical protein